jgi:predicted permease
VPPGFEPEGVVVVNVRPPALKLSIAQRRQFYLDLLERLRAVPGVKSAAAAGHAPGVNGGMFSTVTPEDDSAPAHASSFYRTNPVTPDWFAALGIPFIRGDNFTGTESSAATGVVILNRAAATAFFPGDNSPIGRRLKFGRPDNNAPLHVVIGVVGDVRQRGPGVEPEPEIFLSYAQRDMSRMVLALKLDAGVVPPLAAIRAAIADVARDLPIDDITTLQEQLSGTTAEARFLASLVTAFALLALVLAAVGTYATASYAVACRFREVGIRLALGARPLAVFRTVLLRHSLITLLGIAAGLLLTFWLARFLEGYLFGITVHDPLTVALAGSVIAAAAILAAVGPAARAARVDPNHVLRAH